MAFITWGRRGNGPSSGIRCKSPGAWAEAQAGQQAPSTKPTIDAYPSACRLLGESWAASQNNASIWQQTRSDPEDSTRDPLERRLKSARSTSHRVGVASSQLLLDQVRKPMNRYPKAKQIKADAHAPRMARTFDAPAADPPKLSRPVQDLGPAWLPQVTASRASATLLHPWTHAWDGLQHLRATWPRQTSANDRGQAVAELCRGLPWPVPDIGLHSGWEGSIWQDLERHLWWCYRNSGAQPRPWASLIPPPD